MCSNSVGVSPARSSSAATCWSASRASWDESGGGEAYGCSMGVPAGSDPQSEHQPILITGVTGFVGMEVMARFLQRSRRHIFALIRARNDADAHERLRVVLATTFGDPDAHPGRVTAVAGDIERPGLGLDPGRLDELAEQVDRVLHAAASVSFELALAESRGVNFRGTQHMLGFADRARQRGGLERFTY